jgi:hypothetical protein
MTGKPTFNPYKGIPTSLKVGNFRFAVDVEDAGDSQAARSFGHMNPVNHRIRVAPDQTAQSLADTFLHEALHAIHVYFDLQDDNDEEDFTLFGARGLCQLWQDNPKAMAWWVSINQQGAGA